MDRFNLTEQIYQAQLSWDSNNVQGETLEQKVTRIQTTNKLDILNSKIA